MGRYFTAATLPNWPCKICCSINPFIKSKMKSYELQINMLQLINLMLHNVNTDLKTSLRIT